MTTFFFLKKKLVYEMNVSSQSLNGKNLYLDCKDEHELDANIRDEGSDGY